jgi:hypothetical protein
MDMGMNMEMDTNIQRFGNRILLKAYVISDPALFNPTWEVPVSGAPVSFITDI